MAVFDARQVAAQQAGTLLDVSLRHAFLQPVVSNGLADVDLGEHCRMRHSNQIGIFWQVEISAIEEVHFGGARYCRNRPCFNSVQETIGLLNVTTAAARSSARCYFFKLSARKLTVRFQASAASEAR